MAQHNDLGKEGENIAKNFLIQHGHQIIAVNWRYKHLEIDIVSLKNQTLIFSEVRTRNENHLISPEKTVGLQKQKLLIQAANYFLQENDYNVNFSNVEIRFDIVSVVKNKLEFNVNRVKDAFYPIL